eukprot:40021_1
MHAALSGVGGSGQLWGGAAPTIEYNEADKLLCRGCRKGDVPAVRKALEQGANPSVQFRLALGEITPIFLCASKGYSEIADLLIAKHRDVINDRMGFDGTTCLHHAASNDQPKMCELLIKNGCSVDQKDKLGRTALMDAAEIGSVEVIQVLVRFNADLHIEDKEHHSAVSYCLDFISAEEPKFFEASLSLIQNGANPNYAGKFTSRTLLHYASAQGNLELVKELIEDKQAYITPLDDENKTPLDYAMDNNRQDVVDYLQQAIPGPSGLCSCNIL